MVNIFIDMQHRRLSGTNEMSKIYGGLAENLKMA